MRIENPNIMIFIDGANLFHSSRQYAKDVAKRDWRIDILALVNKLSSGGQLKRTYYFCAVPDPIPYEQSKYLYMLRRSGIVVVPKKLKETPKGKKYEKGVDVSLVTTLLSMAYKKAFDIGVIVSGDEDYVDAAKEVMDQGLNLEIVSFRGCLSKKLSENCDNLLLIDDFINEVELKK